MYHEITQFLINLTDYGVPVLIWLIIFWAVSREYLAWKSLPTLEQYRIAHPDCMTSRGIKCSQYSSASIKNWGVFNAKVTPDVVNDREVQEQVHCQEVAL